MSQLTLLSPDPMRTRLLMWLHEQLRGRCGEGAQTVLPAGCMLLPGGRRQLPIRDLLLRIDELTEAEVVEMVDHYARTEVWYLTTYEGWKDASNYRLLGYSWADVEEATVYLHRPWRHGWDASRCPMVRRTGAGWRWQNGTAHLLKTACRLALAEVEGAA